MESKSIGYLIGCLSCRIYLTDLTDSLYLPDDPDLAHLHNYC